MATRSYPLRLPPKIRAELTEYVHLKKRSSPKASINALLVKSVEKWWDAQRGPTAKKARANVAEFLREKKPKYTPHNPRPHRTRREPPP